MILTLSTIQQLGLRAFKQIDNGKNVLPYAVVPSEDVNDSTYMAGIDALQQFLDANPDQKGFIPSSPDIHVLYSILPPEDIFWVGTGTIVLRRDGNGYADERVVDPEGRRVRLPNTSVGHHGIHWKTNGPNSIMVMDPSKLLPYTEIDAITQPGRYRVAGYDEERGIVTHFNPEVRPVARYGNASGWVNPSLLISPLVRGGWVDDVRERLFYSSLYGYAEVTGWLFPMGRYDSRRK